MHYVVRRARSGRFNFTLLSQAGRIEGTVFVLTAGKTAEEIDREVHEKIRNLAETFSVQQSQSLAGHRPRRLHEISRVDIKAL